MRINLFAGPGAGKSTFASEIFSRMKKQGYSVEFSKEIVKLWTYQKRIPKKWDQITLLGLQMEQEAQPLMDGVKHVVCECPIIMGCVYAKDLGLKCSDQMYGICKDFEREYPSINIFIRRNNKKYNPEGRFHSLEQAIKIDKRIQSMLKNHVKEHLTFNFEDGEAMYSEIIQRIGPPK